MDRAMLEEHLAQTERHSAVGEENKRVTASVPRPSFPDRL
jgi:hypothetical protein